MRYIIYIVIFLITNDAFSFQANDSLLFLIKGTVKDLETKSNINDAEIRILGSDGSINVITTDSLGNFESLLDSDLKFSFTISKPGYLNAKGKEHTLNHKDSKVFIHEYELAPIKTYHCFYVGLNLDSTFTLKPFNLGDDTLILYERNKLIESEQIINRIHKIEGDKYLLTSKGGESKEVIIELTDTSIVNISMDGVIQEYFVGGRSTESRYWHELIKKEN